MKNYAEFIDSKRITIAPAGLSRVPPLNPMLFEFQRDITAWALRRGRAAIFAGTGLGKSFMELQWAKCIADHTKKPVVIVAPLAVSHQFVAEGAHFHTPIEIAESQSDITGPTVYATNYEKLEHFDLDSFGGIVLDESSRIKAHDGKTRTWLIKSCSRIPYRLCATATPAPNDYMELGNHAEFLGVMSYVEMLSMFFNHDGGETSKWTLRRHATNDFWKWLSGWAVCVAHPRDLGYAQDGYDLPPLNYFEHTVAADEGPSIETGTLFAMEAHTLQERLAARRDTVAIRCKKAAEIAVNIDGPCAIWCNLNSESSLLAKIIPGAVEVKGSDSDRHKERTAMAFAKGELPRLVSKGSIFGFGMNFQVCADTIFVGLNDSFETVYQSIRRFWRFGQTKPVNAHFIAADTEGAVVRNLKRKEEQAENMIRSMVKHMHDLNRESLRGTARQETEYNPSKHMELPSWIR